ncbi:MAG TPA: site-specific DNA-methyltransferase [Actinomycetota bacterium]|nr:site-specific DNA-methyltransferase [Actinomycetota bacterium]
MTAQRKPTVTSSFGVSKRESHDSSPFYARFTLPDLSSDDTVNVTPLEALDRIYCSDSRSMPELVDGSVALVVTSPPYFAGKAYEEALGEGAIPGSYVEYLEMLSDVFAECSRKLEPGGRMAVNVANLGRKPYRSLAADVVSILQDRLGLLLRGEVVWVKGQGASGSCAWGSFQSAANPVLRDLSERVIIASKGRFDRALARSVRSKSDLPSENSITKDEFMEATTDVWEIATESAKRVGHPAPFPVELPLRLIELYTYRGDVVLDPFGGSGSTAVAAVRAARHFVAYDTEPAYVDVAVARVETERGRIAQPAATRTLGERAGEARSSGASAIDFARSLLEDAGFSDVGTGPDLPGGLRIELSGTDASGERWMFDVSGGFTAVPSGLRRIDSVFRAIAKAALLRGSGIEERLVVLTTSLPSPGSPGDGALSASTGPLVDAVLDLGAPETPSALRLRAEGKAPPRARG